MPSKWNAEKVTDALRKKIRRRMKLVGEFVETAAKLNAPVDTGNLRASITNKVISWDTVRIGTPVDYAIYQELGTKKMRAQPFLRPAIFANKGAIKRIIEND